jgi:TolB-like protein/DNA-binding winged helix-turn-helix (wHTH) protein/Tfp pilus assembly protein PilF
MKGAAPSGVRHCYEFGPFRLDSVRRRLSREGKFVPLYPKAVEALILLVEHPGEILQREALMEALWPETIVEESNLTVAISHLRKVLGRNGNGIAEFIQTIPRVGYRFVVETREVVEEPQHLLPKNGNRSRSVIADDRETAPGLTNGPAAIAGPTSASEMTAVERRDLPAAHQPPQRAKTGFPTTKWIAAATVVLLCAGALAFYRTLTTPSNIQLSDITSVAVLPLKNLTGTPTDEYLADGLTEGLIGSLSKLDRLKVISRGSVFAFKGKEIHPHEVGRRLGVMSVIEGGILKSNGSARVSLRLVNTNDGRVLWSHESAARSASDLFEIEDELARKATAALRPELAAAQENRLAKQYPKNPEAYLEYLKGRYFWNKRTAADAERAIQHFEQAIALEPNYAQAYAGLADCYAIRTHLPPRVAIPKAMAAALKAIELDDQLAESHVSLATIKELYEWDRKGAEAEYKRAIELNPNYALAHGLYSVYLTSVGRFDEGAAEARRAQEIDPLSPNMHIYAGWNFFNARQYDRSIEEAHKAIDLDPNVSMAYNIIARACAQKQMYNDAIAAGEKAKTISNQGISMMSKEHPLSLASLGYAYAVSGRADEARQIIEALEKLSTVTYISANHLAVIYAGLGQNDRVLEYLEKTFEERDEMQRFVKVSPIFDRLHSDPRFANLLLRVGFSP